MNEHIEKIDSLVRQLNEASAVYYNGQDEIMSNYEWDALFEELEQLEQKTGYIRPDSPTQVTGYEKSSGEK